MDRYRCPLVLKQLLLLLVVSFFVGSCRSEKLTLLGKPQDGVFRHWFDDTVWTNRFVDWRVNKNGYFQYRSASFPQASLYGTLFNLGTNIEVISKYQVQVSVFCPVGAGKKEVIGHLLGAGAATGLSREASLLVQGEMGYGFGVLASVNCNGDLEVSYVNEQGKHISRSRKATPDIRKALRADSGAILRTVVTCERNDECKVSLRLRDRRSLVSKVTLALPKKQIASGRLGLAAKTSYPTYAVMFRMWQVTADETDAVISEVKDEVMGPIITGLYTLSANKLKVTAQLFPIADGSNTLVSLWKESSSGVNERISSVNADRESGVASFSVPSWNRWMTEGEDTTLTVRYLYRGYEGESRIQIYPLTIRKEPPVEDPLNILAVSCIDHTVSRYYLRSRNEVGYRNETIWWPHHELAEDIKVKNPDLLYFAGDQIYEGIPTHGLSSSSTKFSTLALDYMYKWIIFLLPFRKYLSTRPSIFLIDDHDVYQGNIWGFGGAKSVSKNTQMGGYRQPPRFVKLVHKTQTTHLPDPYDATPVAQNIPVYYTTMDYGSASIAIIEDRKWKVPPGLFPVGHASDPKATILGDRQLKFLRRWIISDHGNRSPVILSQTPLACIQTHSSFKLKKNRASVDSNGWPRYGRQEALEALLQHKPLMISGDQHLGTVVQHGLENWDDSSVQFSVPAASNFFPRAWFPEEPSTSQRPGLPFTGRFEDPFGNMINVLAVANPVANHSDAAVTVVQRPQEIPRDQSLLRAGYGVVVVKPMVEGKSEYELECWPLHVGTSPKVQYPGWPIVVRDGDPVVDQLAVIDDGSGDSEGSGSGFDSIFDPPFPPVISKQNTTTPLKTTPLTTTINPGTTSTARQVPVFTSGAPVPTEESTSTSEATSTEGTTSTSENTIQNITQVLGALNPNAPPGLFPHPSLEQQPDGQTSRGDGDSNESSDDLSGTTIGVIIAVICLLVLVIAVALYLWSSKEEEEEEEVNSDDSAPEVLWTQPIGHLITKTAPRREAVV